MNSNIVDLIYLDPPFNSNAVYGAPIGGEKTEEIFKDIWTLRDVDLAWWKSIRKRNKALYTYLDAVDKLHSKSMKSYLIYMAVRLIEMQRLLKSSGSIYLHCDQHASHYLKPLMDAIFGRTKFRNEIVWQRTMGKGLNPTRFLRNTDHIFFIAMERSLFGISTTWISPKTMELTGKKTNTANGVIIPFLAGVGTKILLAHCLLVLHSRRDASYRQVRTFMIIHP